MFGGNRRKCGSEGAAAGGDEVEGRAEEAEGAEGCGCGVGVGVGVVVAEEEG